MLTSLGMSFFLLAFPLLPFFLPSLTPIIMTLCSILNVQHTFVPVSLTSPFLGWIPYYFRDFFFEIGNEAPGESVSP